MPALQEDLKKNQIYKNVICFEKKVAILKVIN